ncbi:hypothetical protein [Acidaminococcus intestini]|jgi:hypothetical protein|uniref:hypothetical protein n=1 Tax=Acidaminococcus intestini TaxID=187327 RepID=UPI002055D9A2|nr:hypothetical protein [Acidaminococcus intestini]DAP59546.1 MAG TPA: hypothetical protein [Caudoviricetes sp.]
MDEKERTDEKMMLAKPPLFMENPEWYTYDVDEGRYKLTDKATKEARESYEDFYKRLDALEVVEEK